MFINAFLIGFGQGFQPVCGFNYGAGLYARVRQGFWFCVKVGFSLLVCAVAGMGYAEEIVSIFRKETLLLKLPVRQHCAGSSSPSVGCMDCGQQHDAADYPQARYDTFLCPSRAVLHPLIFILPYFLGLKGWKCARRRRTC